MHSVSLLLSPGPTLNSSQREGLWGEGGSDSGGGVAETAEKMQKESELLWPMQPSANTDINSRLTQDITNASVRR